MRTKELAKSQFEDIAKQPNESRKAALRTQFGIKEHDNPMFTLTVDMFRLITKIKELTQFIATSPNPTLFCRSTPVETLHTILLGPYKYLLKVFIARLSTQQKREVLSKMSAFNYSGFEGKVLGNVVYHHKSFVGRDYKAWAQMALFVIGPYLSESKKSIWLGLSKAILCVFLLYYFVNPNPRQPVSRAEDCAHSLLTIEKFAARTIPTVFTGRQHS